MNEIEVNLNAAELKFLIDMMWEQTSMIPKHMPFDLRKISDVELERIKWHDLTGNTQVGAEDG